MDHQKTEDAFTASRIFLLLFSIATLINFALRNENLQVFTAYGESKKIILPICYLFLLIFVATRSSRNIVKLTSDMRIITLLFAVSIFLSILNNLIFKDIQFIGLYWFQGTLQLFGFVLFIIAGTRASEYSPPTERYWLATSIFVCTLSGFLEFGMSPFINAYLPFATFLILISKKLLGNFRVIAILIGTSVLITTFARRYSTDTISSAWLLAYIINIGLLILTWIPIYKRMFITNLLVIGILFYFVQSNLLQLLLGRTPDSIVDITLIQRSFEAKVTFETLSENITNFIFGLGPGAYLDLSGSPDYRTLASAGRNLLTVDDAHFLTSWTLLKIGIFGLMIIGLFIIGSFMAAYKIFNSSPTVAPLDFLFTSTCLTGIATSLTAGTNFFTNPILGFSIGVIWFRASKKSMLVRKMP